MWKNSNNNVYAQYGRNEYSQFGEDGILEKILSRIVNKDGWCVEFGAWDGVYLSNTYNLIKNRGYNAVLIEADKNKFRDLRNNMASFNAVLVNEFVTFEGDNRLDKILGKTPIPKDFDVLSIDIDGNDYWILESLHDYRPKVICIEYNPSIPNEVEYVQTRDFTIKRGASAKSICKLAKYKGYELVATTKCNLIFVDKMLFAAMEVEDNSLTSLRDDSYSRNYVFVGYDGTVILSRPLDFFWHEVSISNEDLQWIPRILRRFPADYNLAQKLLFLGFSGIRAPYRTLKRLKFIASRIKSRIIH